MPRHRRTLYLALLVVIMASSVSAFGYSRGVDSATVEPGGSKGFNIYLFGEKTVEMGSLVAPRGWDMEVSPEEIDLSRPGEYDFRYMEIGGEVRKIVEVSIDIRVPEETSGGVYTVETSFRDSGTGSAGTSVSTSQVQEFVYTVNVDGENASESSPSEGEEEPGEEYEGGEVKDDVVQGNRSDTNESNGSEDSPPSSPEPSGEGGVVDTIFSSTVLKAFLIFQFAWIGTLVYLRRRGW